MYRGLKKNNNNELEPLESCHCICELWLQWQWLCCFFIYFHCVCSVV